MFTRGTTHTRWLVFSAVAFCILSIPNLPASEAAVPESYVPSGFTVDVYASSLDRPRGLVVLDNGDIIVVEKGLGRLTLIAKGDASRKILSTGLGLNHGIILQDNVLYASSQGSVYKWPLDSLLSGLATQKEVINNIPTGGHTTRTLIFDSDGNLYVSVGSLGNVDANSDRSRIRKFAKASVANEAGYPIDFNAGEVFADGLRNEVGLAFDSRGQFWGVENGADRLTRPDFGDIHNDNPAEELNLFDMQNPGKFYGYPYCFSEFKIDETNPQPNKQWAWNPEDPKYTDAWCQNTNNVVPPAFSMQAHSAPLGIVFYPESASKQKHGFPSAMVNDAFIPFHGSWNRDIPTGYKVVRVLFDSSGKPTGVEDFFSYGGNGDKGGSWTLRPVEAKVGIDGELYVTSDTSGAGAIYVIKYDPNTSPTPTRSPTTTASPSPVSGSAAQGLSKVSWLVYVVFTVFTLAVLA